MATRQLVHARQELFGVGVFWEEYFPHSIKCMVNDGRCRYDLLAVRWCLAVMSDMGHTGEITCDDIEYSDIIKGVCDMLSE